MMEEIGNEMKGREEETDGEAELNRTQGGDEDAEEDGDGAITHDLSGGTHDAGLAWTHLVPAPRVEKRFLKVSSTFATLFPETHLLWFSHNTKVSEFALKVFVKMSQRGFVLWCGVVWCVMVCGELCWLSVNYMRVRLVLNELCQFHWLDWKGCWLASDLDSDSDCFFFLVLILCCHHLLRCLFGFFLRDFRLCVVEHRACIQISWPMCYCGVKLCS